MPATSGTIIPPFAGPDMQFLEAVIKAVASTDDKKLTDRLRADGDLVRRARTGRVEEKADCAGD
jgi:hypothetical protein